MKYIKYLLLFFPPAVTYSQLVNDSLNFSINKFAVRDIQNNFDKQLNTYNFSTRLRQFYQSNKFFIGLNENFNSTVIKATDNNFKDEQYLWLFSQYNISEFYKIGFMLNNNLYSDDRRVAINKASIMNASMFLKLTPLKNLDITPYGGFSSNSQIGEKDNGLLFGTEAGLDKLSLGEFEVSSLLKFQNEDISPRKNTFRYFNIDVQSNIDQDFGNTISAFYAHQRKDFYFTADQPTIDEFGIDNNIQSRLETNYHLQDRIKFLPQNSPFSLDAQARVVWRDIERSTRYVSLTNPSSSAFDSRIQEFRLEFSSSAEYRTDDVNLSFRFSFAERDEKHQPRKIEGLSNIIFNEREINEAQKNNSSKLATIALSGNIKLSNFDNLLISIFHRKLVYDTPSNVNFDDRDELLSIGRIQYEKIFNPYFKAFLNLEGSLNKIVYIFSERSSNNNIKRILKLSSGGTFSSGKLISTNSAEVMANYTVFDYEELNPNFRSYSFRQFVFRDSTNYQLTNYFRLFITGYLKLSEQGDFKWTSFTSKPQRFLEELYSEPKFFFDFRGFNFGIGIRYFSLSTYNLLKGTEKQKISEYESIGPVLDININILETLSFRTYGWYEFINTDNSTKREMATFNLKLVYKF
ncbi:MAG: hypothetical protein RDU14_00635 [Melioribacteraceae bacterium]|nr:hypothetical protein [Melioribacteraceae bacterium]